jgi:hypothetical protein
LFKRILNNFAFKKSSFLFFNFQIIKSKDWNIEIFQD